MKLQFAFTALIVLSLVSLTGDGVVGADSSSTARSTASTSDWPQWGGTSLRNNTPVGHNIPTHWNIGKFDYRTGEWDSANAKNIKWVGRLGSQSYGNPVVAGGKVFVGTNNSGGWLKRYPPEVDLGCLLCFDTATGKFLWQHSSEKLPTGRVHDWPLQGICCAPLVEGDRLWFVTSRGEVRCLDTEGFDDGENDGPFKEEPNENKDEADVVWSFDMMKEMGVSQHNMADCSITRVGDVLFVCTSNGVDVEHNYIPAAQAPSFFAMHKHTKKVLWTDASPGLNILHGQWSSPAYAVLGGVPQVLFAGGDGWLYSFNPEGDGQGGSQLLWKFDCNPKESHYSLIKATRNHIIGTPVVCDGLVYVAVGEDPEHGEGTGHLWCINPAKKLDGSDVSPELAYNSADPNKPIPHKRLQAVEPEKGDFARPNPNSAAVWHYSEIDLNGDKRSDFEEIMHRTLGSVAIKDNVLYIADYSGLFHCLDAKTGKRHWAYDMLSASWGSPLIVEGKVYIGDEDGDIAIFRHSADPSLAMKEDGGEFTPYYGEINMGNSVYSTPIVAGNVLYISNKTHLFAIAPEEK
ncbi:MAG: PQQ-binding-like beta-propeller repeat protein [Pirellulales bacterium]|nr:PQQ-binding-like beta-propeller repeat protein [Pirellulales bacterium]